MSAPLEQAIEQLWPIQKWGEQRVLVAVSGGADSIALLRALRNMAASPVRLSAAHFNHGWRGSESDGDERFVSELCANLGIALHVGRAELGNPSELARSEEAARDQRYRFLTHTAYKVGARFVCTAHTASDRIETMLHNLFRGTGLAGACSPHLTRALHDELLLVRPLLSSFRDEVLEYLTELGQSFRTDSSNFDTSYKRNFIRQDLLPQIREIYGQQVDRRLAAFAKIAEEAVDAQRAAATEYLQAVERLFDSHSAGNLTQPGPLQIVIPACDQLHAQWPIVHQALIQTWQLRSWSLQSMSREHWQMIRDLWEADSTAERLRSEVVAQLPDHLELCRLNGWIVIRQIIRQGKKKTRSPGHENNKDDDCSQRAPR